jgi:hypothetical protein
VEQLRHHDGNPAEKETGPVSPDHEASETLPLPSLSQHNRQKSIHVGFAARIEENPGTVEPSVVDHEHTQHSNPTIQVPATTDSHQDVQLGLSDSSGQHAPQDSRTVASDAMALAQSDSQSGNIISANLEHRRPSSHHDEESLRGYLRSAGESARQDEQISRVEAGAPSADTESEKFSLTHVATRGQAYTHNLRQAPAKSFRQHLQVYHGRLNNDKWWKIALRPFILYAYPAVLWSSAVYACSIGWLIVISESVAVIYREGSYKFGALATGLVYISPFLGGILGTAVAGRVSDVIVKAMARRNGGLYEPEFRLVMAAPIAITTVIGLMGFGWSADVHDHWIVPTVFFGVVSFGCSLGSTTSITFCVDSYRQYAGEALVTLNFSKNVLHGLVFSLFVTGWLEHDGSKTVFIWIGVIQLIFITSTIPMYIFGKRARMWTVRRNLMEKF